MPLQQIAKTFNLFRYVHCNEHTHCYNVYMLYNMGDWYQKKVFYTYMRRTIWKIHKNIVPPPNGIGQIWIMYALDAILLMFHLTYICMGIVVAVAGKSTSKMKLTVCLYSVPQKIIIIIEINERAKARIAESHSKIIISMILLFRHTRAST